MKKRILTIAFVSLVISIPLIIIFSGILLVFSKGIDGKILDFYSELKNVQENVIRSERTVLSEESAIVEVVSNASDSVVSIAVRQVELDPELGPQNNESNIGTGFIVRPGGLIVTNQHVVSDNNADYVVTTKDQKVFEITGIFRDEINDLALIQVDSGDEELPYLELGDSGSLQIGQLVVAIGTPLGDYPGTVTTGIVSGLNRSVVAGSAFWGAAKEYENVIQTDAAINPGNSGGPLLNSNSQVIGINFATTSGADNISFAIPSNVLKERLEEFEASGGRFIKPYLGVVYQTIDEFDSIRFDVPIGAFVEEVEKDGPAFNAGVKSGDIITEISGEEVSKGLAQKISAFEAGETVTLKIWRKIGDTYKAGEYLELEATLGEKSD